MSWNTIYKEYFSKTLWTFIDEGINRKFAKFIRANGFEHKKALDLGCGPGWYFSYLQKLGFEVVGVDISSRAIEEARKTVRGEVKLEVADIYQYEIPKNEFDLVICIATIQHATKTQIDSLINRIYENLIPGGKVYIDFPNMNVWATFREYEELEPGTVIPLEGPEKGIPHSYYSKKELEHLFRNFEDVKIQKDRYRVFAVTAVKPKSVAM